METGQARQHPITIYLDTAVWIPFVYHTQYSETSERNAYPIRLLETLIAEDGVTILFSPAVSTEISSHLREGFILDKLRRDGYSFKELNQYKKSYFLTEREIEELNRVITSLGELPNVESLHIEGLTAPSMQNVYRMIAHYHFDFYDALHYEIARRHACSYFVTTDAHLLKSIGEYQSGSTPEVEAIKPKALYQKM